MAKTVQHAARVLGLGSDTTIDEVRETRRSMAMRYHPDVTQDTAQATRHMARINDAADRLITHLNTQTTTGRCPLYPDFSDVTQRRKTAHQPRTHRARPQPARTQSTQSSASSKKATTVAVVHSEDPVSRNTSLTKFASESYSKVLGEIGSAAQGPNLDIRVLKYS